MPPAFASGPHTAESETAGLMWTTSPYSNPLEKPFPGTESRARHLEALTNSVSGPYSVDKIPTS